jgi:N-sulfoglucosamine sulfohydrolase
MKHHRLLLTFMIPLALGGCKTMPESSQESSRPNILFAIADDASWNHFGAYGCEWVKTPAFDRVAREGILFTHAYTPNAKCAPSRSCILTGRNSWQLEEAANHSPLFPSKFKTYAEALGEQGYWVGSTAKGWAPGDPGEINGRKRQLTGRNSMNLPLRLLPNIYRITIMHEILKPSLMPGLQESLFVFGTGALNPTGNMNLGLDC